MLRFLPFPQNFSVLPDSARALSHSLEQEVEAIWQMELSKRGPGLFNGPLFSLEQISGETVTGRFVEYRLFLAQMRRPELYASLRIQPLAVTGLLQNAEGLFFGYRSPGVAHQPDCWELIPAGGIDRSTRTKVDQIQPIQQLLAELEEEVGLKPASVAPPQLVCFCEDPVYHIFDLVWKLEAMLDTASILHAHASLNQAEHTRITCVPWIDMEGFLADGSHRITVGSRELLHHISPQKNHA